MRLRELSSPREGDDVELGREERDRWVCCRTGYLTNVRPKPARVGYKRVSVTPSPEFSPHKAPISFPLFLFPFSPFFFFLPTSRRRYVARRGCPCTIESFRFYEAAIVGVIHVEIRYGHYARRIQKIFRQLKNSEQENRPSRKRLEYKEVSKDFTNYGYLLHSCPKLISLDIATAILCLSWK